jgi:hypothetical protein
MSANLISILARRRLPVFGGAGINPQQEAGFVASHYRYFRKVRGMGVGAALSHAETLPATYTAGREYYGPMGVWGAAFGESGDTLRHVDDTGKAGLRFVGYADELARLDHTGWFTDEEQHGKFRGAVWQLAGKGKQSRIVYGYQEWDGDSETNVGSALICTSTVLLADMSDGNYSLGSTDEVQNAATYADGLAESAADKAREYNEAYRKGSTVAETDSTFIETRRQLLPILAELRKVRHGRIQLSPVMCDLLTKRVESDLDTLADLRESVRMAWGDCPSYAEEAWLAGFMDTANGNGFVRAVRLGFAKASDWKGPPAANPCATPEAL